MENKSVIIRKPGKGLSRWMLLTDPLTKKTSGSGLVLKGHHPQFIFEIVPPNDDPDCHKVDFQGTTHYVMVRKCSHEEEASPTKYMVEMLKWYTSVKAKPSLREISQTKLTD